MFGPRDFDLVLGVASFGCIGFVVVFCAFVSFLAAVSRAVSRVTPENRRIEPGQVWLNLIPGFGLVWLPITVDRVADSLKAEYIDRGLHDRRASYGRTTGLTALTLGLVTVLLAGAGTPLGVVCVFGTLAAGVSYWAQVSGYGARLKGGAYTPPDAEW